MNLLSTNQKNDVLREVRQQLVGRHEEILSANQRDLTEWHGSDTAMYDRLIINSKKMAGMLKALDDIIADNDPVGKELYTYDHPNGMKVVNKTAPFGTVLIIYESRPDVTIEAAMVAFKSNNKILLKGGKEAINSNRILVDCWHSALKKFDLGKDWVTLLELNRSETQSFLIQPDRRIDLIVPRGGEGLITFVKAHASCPVLISGRGNNFLYVHDDADWRKTIPVIINSKTHKISACNALDKVLINRNVPDLEPRIQELLKNLKSHKVAVLSNQELSDLSSTEIEIKDLSEEWDKEYLSMRLSIGIVDDMDQAIQLINTHSGRHSSTIMTEDKIIAEQYMNQVDVASVIHNASTRFTDGGEFGLGAELAISTDKLHHRGPLGLHQLVTNKWLVFGDGQTR